MEMIASFVTGGGGTVAAGASLGQIGGSVFKAIAGFAAAGQKSKELKVQAAHEEFAARDEYIRGKQQQTAIYQELANTVSNQAVAFAAGGVSLGSISVGQARSEAVSDGENALFQSISKTSINQLGRLRNATNLRRAAKNVRKGAVLDAIGIGFETYNDIQDRG